MKERTNTRDHPIGPHTLGLDLLPGDVVLLPKTGKSIRNMTKVRVDERGDFGWRATVLEGQQPPEGRTLTVFYADKYILVDKGS